MKIYEAIEVLRHEAAFQAQQAGRSDHGRLLNILATDLERCQLWARIKTPDADTHLYNPNQSA